MPPAATTLRFACPARLRLIELALPDGKLHRLDIEKCDEDEEHCHDFGDHSVVLRRVHCDISAGLLGRDDPNWELHPQARAALLWHAFHRFDRLDGVKRLSGGLSGSDVLVFRPRLRAPQPSGALEMATAGPLTALDGSWGNLLLVKTGPADDIRQEWTRSQTFLRDRQSPFVIRPEHYIDVAPLVPLTRGEKPRATLISSFLSGEGLNSEPLDQLIRGTRDPAAAIRAIDAVVALLGGWHTRPRTLPLAQWSRAFRFADGGPPDRWPEGRTEGRPEGKTKGLTIEQIEAQLGPRWLAFSQYNLRKDFDEDPKFLRNKHEDRVIWDMPKPDDNKPSRGRREFAQGVAWDIPFGKEDHLETHLLGPATAPGGLLHRLAELPALFSLVHGDLNPRNVLCDGNRVWLIDFQKTGVGPALADLARLEANLRLWCINLGPATDGAADAVRRLEHLLLDHFHGGECSLEPVRRFATALGADPDELEKVARCVVHLRRVARAWCVDEFADGRDYLAVLYLTVLGLIPLAGHGHTGPTNERWMMGLYWALEETLDRLLGRPTYDRKQLPYTPLAHVSANLARGPGLARRLHDLCNTADGRLAMAPVVALRGVLQGGYHHLDAYHHTLAVVAYLEAILADPLAALQDPAALDETVEEVFAAAGIALSPPDDGQTEPPPPDVPWLDAYRTDITRLLHDALAGDAKLALRWCAILHDVGKPGTRTVRLKADGKDVQFLGHEVYGVSLLRGHLSAWFPGHTADTCSQLGEQVKDLIRHHHTSHQRLTNLFTPTRDDPRTLSDLRAVLEGGHRPGVIKWLAPRTEPADPDCPPHLPLLLLHGYADRLAARGSRQGATVTEWAEATIAMLAFQVRRAPLVDACVASERRLRDVEKAPQRAADAYATELGYDRDIDGKTFGRAVAELKRACAGCAGTADELLAHLRRVVSASELTRRLRDHA